LSSAKRSCISAWRSSSDFDGFTATNALRVRRSLPNCSGFGRDYCDQRFDITERESETLIAVPVTFDLRHMIRHHHAVETNLFIDAHGLQHIDITVVDECFLEIQKPSTDVPEMDVEDLFASAEVADDIENFLPRFLQHLRHSPLAEVQPVIRALFDGHELLETINRTEHGFDSPETTAARHSGVLRMAGQPHLVFFGYQDNALKEVGNTLPVFVRIDGSGLSQRRILLCFFVDERAVLRPSAPFGGLGARYPEKSHVVFEAGNACAGRVPDHLTDIIDFAIALRAFPQHD